MTYAKESGASYACAQNISTRRRDLAGQQFGRLKFLIIEQNLDMQQNTAGVLRALGASRLRMTNGIEDAFNTFLEDPADIILSDWGPNLDALELLRQIRTDPMSPNAFVPFILVCAGIELHQVHQARDRGVTDFLAKPCTRPKLYERVCAVIQRQDKFVTCDAYVGPDRRRRSAAIPGEDRRNLRQSSSLDDEWSVLN